MAYYISKYASLDCRSRDRNYSSKKFRRKTKKIDIVKTKKKHVVRNQESVQCSLIHIMFVNQTNEEQTIRRSEIIGNFYSNREVRLKRQ